MYAGGNRVWGKGGEDAWCGTVGVGCGVWVRAGRKSAVMRVVVGG